MNRLAARRIPKLLGADHEMGNFITGRRGDRSTGRAASRALLGAFPGYPIEWQYSLWDAPQGSFVARYDPQDWGRRWLTNGGCAYIDLDHLELPIAEARSARDYVIGCHAMYRLARTAAAAVNADLPRGERVIVVANNSDGCGASYGAHLNVLMSRPAWEELFNRRMLQLLVLATHQVSSIIYTGLGKVGTECDTPEAAYQLSQRADFFASVVGIQTTYDRPVVNSRDESHATATGARLHCIFYDQNLCHTAAFLKAGVMQIVTSMLEGGWCDNSLALEDPVASVVTFSHDPGLTARARLADGRDLTALELQWLLLEHARRFDFDGLVPGAAAILDLWEDTLERLRRRDFDTLQRRLDWVLKRTLLERARSRGGLDWDAPQLRHLDVLYSSLDPAEGLYWACERGGAVDVIATEEEIADRAALPPPDTRAWTRGRLLDLAGEAVETVDWDLIRLRVRGSLQCIRLADPLGFTRAETQHLFEGRRSLDEILEGLEDCGAAVFEPASAARSVWSGYWN
jgi:hypothetical protein